jgi:hypothetical protein
MVILPAQNTDKAAVEEDIKGNVRPLSSHQNRSSVSVLPWLRARTTSSRSGAESVSVRVRICTAGSPASRRDIVPCHRWICSPSAPWLRPTCLRARRTKAPGCFSVRAIRSVMYASGNQYTRARINIWYTRDLPRSRHAGKGSGSALVIEALRAVDARELPAYLALTRFGNVPSVAGMDLMPLVLHERRACLRSHSWRAQRGRDVLRRFYLMFVSKDRPARGRFLSPMQNVMIVCKAQD